MKKLQQQNLIEATLQKVEEKEQIAKIKQKSKKELTKEQLVDEQDSGEVEPSNAATQNRIKGMFDLLQAENDNDEQDSAEEEKKAEEQEGAKAGD